MTFELDKFKKTILPFIEENKSVLGPINSIHVSVLLLLLLLFKLQSKSEYFIILITFLLIKLWKTI